MRQFDFGQNWSDFSSSALTDARVRQAREDFAKLMALAGVELTGRSFLDIGFGQGLSLMSACSMGAQVVGCDINPLCAEVLDRNRRRFPEDSGRPMLVVVGSILDPAIVETLRQMSPDGAGHEVVHSWGALHHTGRMWQAIDNAASLVRPGGKLILALYNRHWTSPVWNLVKRAYVGSPQLLRRALVAVLYPIIFGAKWAVTRRNPMGMDRGMSFHHNVVDWVGGYPYEYASIEEVTKYLVGKRFSLEMTVRAGVPTGCNEFAFVREA